MSNGQNTSEQLTISVEEAAKLLGISRGLAYQAAQRGELPTIRLGAKRLVVPRARLLEMLGQEVSAFESTEPAVTNRRKQP